MLFNEYGNKENLSILSLHGMLQDWHSQYETLKDLEEKYRLIIPAIDGMYPNSPDFTSFVKQCEQIEDFVNKNYDGHLHCVHGVSQGATILSELLSRNKIKIDMAILDGIYVAHQGKICAWLGCRLFRRLKKNNGNFPKAISVVMKLMGLSEDDLKMLDATYYGFTDNTLKANLYENYTYRANPDISNTDTKVYLWCGSKEPYAKKSHNILKKYLKNYEEEIFEGYGHGEMFWKEKDKYIKKIDGTIGKNIKRKNIDNDEEKSYIIQKQPIIKQQKMNVNRNINDNNSELSER